MTLIFEFAPEPELTIQIGQVGPQGGQGPQGVQGPQGAQGAQGPSGTATALTLLAGPRAIGGHKAVRLLTPTIADLVDATSIADRNACIGVSTGAASSGAAVTIITSGIISEPSWSWTPGGDVFLGDTPGQLTQAYSASRAFSQVVGKAIDATTLWVDLRTPVTL